MQLVVSGNRILAHGEDCFLAMGGTVICTESGRVFQNATVVTCEGCPSDLGKVGYEYHAGQFVPCAPYGVGDGNVAVLCADSCKSIKDSGILFSELLKKLLPAGGTTGQVLAKASDKDGDCMWVDMTGELPDGDEVAY